MLKGGQSGPVIVPGQAAQSELLRRVRLPLDDQDHMPPEGKPQPAPEDLALLEWWVEAGAPGDKRVDQLNPPSPILRLLQARQPSR